MICKLCNKLIELDTDKSKLMVEAQTHYMHKKCLRKATKKQLIEKGIIRPDDLTWWLKYNGEK